jgi:hypothetical protein
MLAQYLVVALIVLGCAAYSTWTLMPAALRRRVATALAPLPWPSALAEWLAKHSTQAAGCACDGCDRSVTPKARADGPVPITFHARTRR